LGTPAMTTAAEDRGSSRLSIPRLGVDERDDGVDIPYVEIHLEGGTFCPLSGEPRQAVLQLSCGPSLQWIQMVEKASCSYLAIIEFPQLCALPQLRPPEKKVSPIQCIALPADLPHHHITFSDDHAMHDTTEQDDDNLSVLLTMSDDRDPVRVIA